MLRQMFWWITVVVAVCKYSMCVRCVRCPYSYYPLSGSSPPHTHLTTGPFLPKAIILTHLKCTVKCIFAFIYIFSWTWPRFCENCSGLSFAKLFCWCFCFHSTYIDVCVLKQCCGSGYIIFSMDPDPDPDQNLPHFHHLSPPPSHLIFHPFSIIPQPLLLYPTSLTPPPPTPQIFYLIRLPSSFNTAHSPPLSSLIPYPFSLISSLILPPWPRLLRPTSLPPPPSSIIHHPSPHLRQTP